MRYKLILVNDSFARLIRFLFILEGIEEIISLSYFRSTKINEINKVRSQLKRSTLIFLKQAEFPFLTEQFNLHCKLSSSSFLLRLYNFCVKFRISFFTQSLDDFLRIDEHFSEFDLGKLSCFEMRLEKSALLHISKESSTLNTLSSKEKVILYCIRDGIWSKTMGHSHVDTLTNRNSSPNLFVNSIKNLCARSIFVVKVGRTSKVLDLDDKNFFDYSSWGGACDLWDFVLWKKAIFAVTTGFGADEPSFLFKTPVLYANYGESLNREGWRGDYGGLRAYLPKTVLWRESGSLLTRSELEDIGFFGAQHYDDTLLQRLGIYLADNTAEEIDSAVERFYSLVVERDESGFTFIHGRRLSKAWRNL